MKIDDEAAITPDEARRRRERSWRPQAIALIKIANAALCERPSVERQDDLGSAWVVQIPDGTPVEAIDWVVRELNGAGWSVERNKAISLKISEYVKTYHDARD